jgi:hypothetical protein
MYFASWNTKQKFQIMKQIIAGALVMLALLASADSFAQRDPAARAAEMKQKLISDLKLTDVQADSVVSINQAFAPQRREIFRDESLSQDDKRTKMKAITEQADKRIQAVLGDDLFKQYQDWRMKNMQRRRNN